MTADTSLASLCTTLESANSSHAEDATGEVAVTPLPVDFSGSDAAGIIYGVPAWMVYHYDECDYDDLIVHTHDHRRAMAVASYMARKFESERMRPAWRTTARITETGWCLPPTACGCTTDQHADHFDAEIGECVGCKHPELPPCQEDAINSWMFEESTEGTPCALPYLRIELS